MHSSPKYLAPADLHEALALANRHDNSAFLAGGTSRRLRDADNDLVLIDLAKLGLDTVHADATGLRLGAMASLEQLRASEAVREHSGALLAEASARSGHPVWRHHATLGGRLLDPDVDDLLHATLLIMDASVVSQTAPRGRARTQALIDFDANDAGLVLEIVLPRRTGWRCAVDCLRQTAYEAPLVGVGVGIQVTAERVVTARVAACGVGIPRRRASRTESTLEASAWPPAAFEAAQDAFQNDIRPHDDARASAAFRRSVASTLLGRLLSEVAARGPHGSTHAHSG